MILVETIVKGNKIVIHHQPENEKIYGASVYSIRIDGEGMLIIGLGDDLEEALLYHAAYVKRAILGQEVFTTKNVK